MLAGAALAAEREPELVIFDGSGAAIPPVETDARVLVTSTRQPRDVVTGYLNAYRILVSDLVVVTGGLDERAGRRDPRRSRSCRSSRSSCGRARPSR